MGLSTYDYQNLAAILAGEGDWFTSKLLRVISTADTNNRMKLYMGFPEEVEAVTHFQTGKPFSPHTAPPILAKCHRWLVKEKR